MFIVGGEVYNDCIGLPSRKIVLLFSTEGSVARTLRHAADLLVIGRQGMVRVIVPPADDAPTTLGDKAVLSPERIGGQAGVVVFGAEKGTDPVLLLPGSQRTLAAGDAVSHKFQPTERLRQGQKFAAGIFYGVQLQKVGGILLHRLYII